MTIIKIEKGKVNIKIDGEIHELIADTLVMIRAVYDSIQNQNKGDAELYQECVKRLVHTCFIDDLGEVNGEYKRVEQELDDEIKDDLSIWFDD